MCNPTLQMQIEARLTKYYKHDCIILYYCEPITSLQILWALRILLVWHQQGCIGLHTFGMQPDEIGSGTRKSTWAAHFKCRFWSCLKCSDFHFMISMFLHRFQWVSKAFWICFWILQDCSTCTTLEECGAPKGQWHTASAALSPGRPGNPMHHPCLRTNSTPEKMNLFGLNESVQGHGKSQQETNKKTAVLMPLAVRCCINVTGKRMDNNLHWHWEFFNRAKNKGERLSMAFANTSWEQDTPQHLRKACDVAT